MVSINSTNIFNPGLELVSIGSVSNTASTYQANSSLNSADTLTVSSMLGGLGGGIAGGIAGSLTSFNGLGVISRVLNKIGLVKDVTVTQSVNPANMPNFSKATISFGNEMDMNFTAGKNQMMKNFAQFNVTDKAVNSVVPGEVPANNVINVKAVQQNNIIQNESPVSALKANLPKVSFSDTTREEFSTGNETVKKLSDQPLLRPTLRSVASGTINGAKYGIAIGGAVSLLSNGVQLLIGKKSGPDALGSVAADTVSAGLSAAGGGLIGGLTAFGLSSLSIGAAPFMAISAGAGLIGAVAGHYLIQKSGLYDAIKNKIKGYAEK